MLSATIGLIVRAGLATAEAEASAGEAQSATATANEVVILDTPANIDQLLVNKPPLDEMFHHVKCRSEDSQRSLAGIVSYRVKAF